MQVSGDGGYSARRQPDTAADADADHGAEHMMTFMLKAELISNQPDDMTN